MEISEKLLCLFSADVREEDGEYVVEVPRREIETGSLEPGETYRVALISQGESETAGTTDEGVDTSASRADDGPQPPVEPGRCATSRSRISASRGRDRPRRAGVRDHRPGHGGRRAR